jgi:hypothetical protein
MFNSKIIISVFCFVTGNSRCKSGAGAVLQEGRFTVTSTGKLNLPK